MEQYIPTTMDADDIEEDRQQQLKEDVENKKREEAKEKERMPPMSVLGAGDD